MKIFLTGASGYLGGVLADHLLRLPEIEQITGIGLRPPPGLASPRFRFVTLDIRSAKVPEAMAGHDVVIHGAAVVLWSASMPARERDDINLNGTRNVAEAAVAAGIRRFLHVSSMAVYDPHQARGVSEITEDFPKGGGDPFFYYWSSKAAAERIVGDVLSGSGISSAALRPTYIIGPRNSATVRGMRENAVRFPGRNPRRQFIHEDDVAAAFIHALRQGLEGPYNVVPDDVTTMGEACRAVGAPRVLTVPPSLAGWVTWLKWRFMGSPIHPSWVQDILVDFTGSNAKLKATGWSPRYGSLESVRLAAAAR
ncbi:MAG: NAD-dependent epimerase/dehydratase family protein [Limisphaerales bacterium]